jgi:CBS domain-containing protein
MTTPAQPKRDAEQEPELLDPDTAVSWIMNREVITVPPDLSLEGLEEMLIAQDLSRVPVVDKAGTLIGIVSKTDLLAFRHDEGDRLEPEPVKLSARRGVKYTPGPGFHETDEGRMFVSDIMHTEVLTVTPETTLARAAELMAVNRVHGLPVLSPQRTVVGWVSTLDILSWVAGLSW